MLWSALQCPLRRNPPGVARSFAGQNTNLDHVPLGTGFFLGLPKLGCGEDRVECDIELTNLPLGLQVRHARFSLGDGRFEVLLSRFVFGGCLLQSLENLA